MNTESGFTVIDLETDEDHGQFETLEEARGCVKFDRLPRYQIWGGGVRIVNCDPYDGDDDRARQGVGESGAVR